MHKYVIARLDGKVQVLKLYGQEAGIPVYEHYHTFPEGGKGPGAFERAGDMVRRLEATA